MRAAVPAGWAARLRRPASLRTGLLLLALVCLAPAVGLSIWHLGQLQRQAVSDGYRQAELLMRSVEGAVNWQLRSAAELLQQYAALPAVRSLREPDCQPYFNVPLSAEYAAMVLRREDGTAVCSTLPTSTPPEFVHKSDWFAAGLAAPGFHVSGSFFGAGPGRWIAPTTHPVVAPDGSRGLLVLPLDLSHMQDHFSPQVPEGTLVVVADQNERVLLHSRDGERRFGTPAFRSVAEAVSMLKARGSAVAPGTPVHLRTTDRNGVPRLFVLAQMPATGWYVLAGVPEDDALAGPLEVMGESAVAIALMLVATVLFASRLARGIAVPIESLAGAARSHAGMQPSRVQAQGPVEVRALACAFNDMAAANEAAWAALQQQKAQFERMLTDMPIGVVACDAECRVRFVNPAAWTIFGVTEDELRAMEPGSPRLRFFDERGAVVGAAQLPVCRALASGAPIRDEALGFAQVADGATLPTAATGWILLSAFPLRGDRGAVEGVLCSYADITEKRAAVELRHAKEAAEAASKAKTQFLSQVSHELRTPLNSILGFSQLMQMLPAQSDKAREYLQYVRAGGEHLLALVNDVLEIGRIESGRVALARAIVPVTPLVEACLREAQPQADRAGVTLAWQVADDDAGVHADVDAVRMRQILFNLLSNAIKFNRAGGQVRAELRRATDADGRLALQVAITDTGPGLTEAQLGQLFQPFNRLGAEYRGVPGTGLGLSVSRLLARSMGGDIAVQSSVGAGSCFTLTLPLADPAP